MNFYGTDIVIMSDIDIIKQTLEAINYRPNAWFLTIFRDRNLLTWSGQKINSQKKFALRVSDNSENNVSRSPSNQRWMTS